MAPMILELVSAGTMVDVGCGVGPWASVFQGLGVEAWGVDGEWVDPGQLLIAQERFVVADLSRGVAMDRRFDLAISMEVAEHLPETSADGFVASLTRLAPVVVFSAAAPMQGGTGHVNEQWPAYWAAKFAAHGFAPIDCLRRRVWNEGEVAWWYAQNTIVYVSEEGRARNPALRALGVEKAGEVLPLIHPACLATHLNAPLSLGGIARGLPRALAAAVRGRLP